MYKNINNKGITLISLVITTVILLLLAGIMIATLGGENGLLARVTQAKQAQIESEMKEELTLAVQELQIEKTGNATLDDITQEWIYEKITDYDCTVKEDASINGKRIIMEKSGIIYKFLIDEDLNITVIEESESGAQLEYEAISRDGENVKILVTITDKENGLQQVEFPDGTIIYCNGEEEISKDYEVQLGVECKVKITSKDGQIKEETILINDYYHKITKNLGEGISIDNIAVKAAYNKPYQATITVEDEYRINEITVTMGGTDITSSVVNKTEGKINILSVTGDITVTIITHLKNLPTRYLLLEVQDHLAEDGAVINEIEIYNEENLKCSYIILNNLEYDSVNMGKSTYWTDSLWNYTNLNDGATAYGDNSEGRQNCTIFLCGSTANTNHWARFIIDLKSEVSIGNVKVCLGGGEGRQPSKITAYSINNFVNGTDTDSTYNQNVKNKNDGGLTKIGERNFTKIDYTPVWYDL